MFVFGFYQIKSTDEDLMEGGSGEFDFPDSPESSPTAGAGPGGAGSDVSTKVRKRVNKRENQELFSKVVLGE